MTKCSSTKCKVNVDEQPSYAVFWPGAQLGTLRMCEECSKKARAVGEAIDCSIVILPWVSSEHSSG